MVIEVHKDTDDIKDACQTLLDVHDYIGKMSLSDIANGAVIDIVIKTK